MFDRARGGANLLLTPRPLEIPRTAVRALKGNIGMLTSLAKRLPWLELTQAFWLARVATAVFFMAHAVGRIVLGTIPQFG